MLVTSHHEFFLHAFQTLKSIVNRVTELFFKIFYRGSEREPTSIKEDVIDLTREIPPNLFEKQGYLIRQKSRIHHHVRTKGLAKQFYSTHSVEKIGDCFVKGETEIQRYSTPLALLEKLAWNVAQILGHESFFCPTNIVRFSDLCLSEMKDCEINTIRFRTHGAINLATYQIDSGTVLRECEDQLSESAFDDIFSFVLIYGMYDSHNNNILLKNGRPVFFDNARILPPTNQFLYNSFGYMLPLRLELMGHKKAFMPLSELSRERILKRVQDTLSRFDKLKSYLSDPVIQIQFEALPTTWFDPDKSLYALKERLEIMRKTLETLENATYNDLVYAIYPKIKLYAALVFQKLHKIYPAISLERALSEIGYMRLKDCFKYEERLESVILAEYKSEDSLETIYAKAKTGPYFEYSVPSMSKYFSKEEFKAPVPRNHPYFKFFASIVFHYKFKKSANYRFDQIVRYLDTVSLNDCFRSIKEDDKVNIAKIEPNDTFEDLFRKAKEGPFSEYTKDSIPVDFLEEAEVNLIEAAYPLDIIADHLNRRFDLSAPFRPNGFYMVNGDVWHVNQTLIPGSPVLSYKGARLPPMPLDIFKKWLSDGIMPKPQADAIAQIDRLNENFILPTVHSDIHLLACTLGAGEVKYIQRRYGKNFVIKRVHRDEAGNIRIDSIDKPRPMEKKEPLLKPKAIYHKEADEITASTVPGYYIVEIDEVFLPPMTEAEVMAWFESDRKEYHRLKQYKDRRSIAVHKSLFDQTDELVNIYGERNLIQIIDTSPVEHFFYECLGCEFFCYRVFERGNRVGYVKEGHFVELFRLKPN